MNVTVWTSDAHHSSEGVSSVLGLLSLHSCSPFWLRYSPFSYPWHFLYTSRALFSTRFYLSPWCSIKTKATHRSWSPMEFNRWRAHSDAGQTIAPRIPMSWLSQIVFSAQLNRWAYNSICSVCKGWKSPFQHIKNSQLFGNPPGLGCEAHCSVYRLEILHHVICSCFFFSLSHCITFQQQNILLSFFAMQVSCSMAGLALVELIFSSVRWDVNSAYTKRLRCIVGNSIAKWLSKMSLLVWTFPLIVDACSAWIISLVWYLWELSEKSSHVGLFKDCTVSGSMT